ncbi:hypothetical protein PQO03_14125 [Lentisphaera profundi]|uniref:Zinc-finger domain-containing protein n=1 Tax=Lentisphaera profundi TaxID=1658616 RepID=A0ABY7VXN2_9BACT|nr:hypothetical protein [Lentisphaera profundi]WDE98973.1 hypothetical protein PQO03_14125 [Lentisphaera profundi]
MNCLSEFQHELLLKDKAGIKKFVWQRHLNSCELCQNRQQEVKENLQFYQGLEKNIGRKS